MYWVDPFYVEFAEAVSPACVRVEVWPCKSETHVSGTPPGCGSFCSSIRGHPAALPLNPRLLSSNPPGWWRRNGAGANSSLPHSVVFQISRWVRHFEMKQVAVSHSTRVLGSDPRSLG